MVEGWARAASWIVVGLVVAGVTLAWLLVGQLDLLVTTAYGWALLAKVALVGVLLGFAAWHCGSAWNRNPVGGVIGVQTGPH